MQIPKRYTIVLLWTLQAPPNGMYVGVWCGLTDLIVFVLVNRAIDLMLHCRHLNALVSSPPLKKKQLCTYPKWIYCLSA